MSDRNIVDEIKHQWKFGGMHVKLIGVNLLVFLVIAITGVFARLAFKSDLNAISYFMQEAFVLHGNPKELLTHPWGLFTSIFAHFEFLHFAFNMLFLFFAGRMFLQLFSASRLLYTYILGGLFGGVIQIIAHLVFPGLDGQGVYVVGASGSIMAIFSTVAFYRPQAEVRLFGVLPVKLIVLALLFILQDLLSLGRPDGVAHFAHLGGMLLGFLAIQNLNKSSNIISWAENVGTKITSLFKGNKKPKMKASRGGGFTKPYNTRSDADYNTFKKSNQEEVDRILDKISKAGYDSLNKKEKQILFEQSRNGK